MKAKVLYVLGVLSIFTAAGAADDAKQEVSGSFIDVIIDSGFIGILIWLMLLACSIVTVWVMIDAIFKIKRNKICPDFAVQNCEEYLRFGDTDSLLKFCGQNKFAFTNIMARTFGKLTKGYNIMEETAATAVRDEEEKLMQKINYLSLCGTIAPMLGLLGTVTGMVSAFFTLGNTTGVEKAQLLAMSISQALYTTAAGLFISVPAIVAYTIFKNKIANEITYTEQQTGDILEGIKDRLQ